MKRTLPNKHTTLSHNLTSKRGNVALAPRTIHIILPQLIGEEVVQHKM